MEVLYGPHVWNAGAHRNIIVCYNFSNFQYRHLVAPTGQLEP